MKNRNPPYIPIGWIDAFFELVKRIRVNKVDRHFIAQYEICSIGNSSKVVSALKFLNIISEEGEIIEDTYNSLRLEGETKTKGFKQIIQNAYLDLFEKIDVEVAQIQDLTNYFIGNFRFSAIQGKGAVKFFLYMIKLADLKVSEEISRSLKPIKKGRPARSKTQRESKSKTILPSFESTKNVQSNVIVINVIGKGVSMNLQIKNKRDIKPNLEIISKILELNLED